MFSLIITIISIALVAALAVATIYYGGSAFTQGSAKANASALVGAAQQISGANTLYFNDKGGNAATQTDLKNGGYLQAVPTAPANTTINAAISATGGVTGTVTTKAVCDAIVSSITGAVVSSAVSADDLTRQYNCYGNGPSSYLFRFQ